MRSHPVIDHLRRQLDGKAGRFPDAGRLAWRWFNDLCRTRTSNGYGPNPISFAEIEAYARLYRWPLEPRHVELILDMDRTWLEWARTAGSPSGGGKAPPRSSGQPMTPAAFDAVFS
jgi:hypothetical protein